MKSCCSCQCTLHEATDEINRQREPADRVIHDLAECLQCLSVYCWSCAEDDDSIRHSLIGIDDDQQRMIFAECGRCANVIEAMTTLYAAAGDNPEAKEAVERVQQIFAQQAQQRIKAEQDKKADLDAKYEGGVCRSPKGKGGRRVRPY